MSFDDHLEPVRPFVFFEYPFHDRDARRRVVRLHVRTLASQLGDLPEVMAEGRDDRDGDVPYRVVIGVLEKPEGDAGDVEGVVPERDLRKDVAYTRYLASLRIGDRIDDRGTIAVPFEEFHDPVDAFQHAGEACLMRLDHLAVEGLGCHEGLAARRLQLVCLHARVFAGRGRENRFFRIRNLPLPWSL